MSAESPAVPIDAAIPVSSRASANASDVPCRTQQGSRNTWPLIEALTQGACVLGVHDPVGIPLFGQEPLALCGEVLVQGVPGDK